MTLEWDDVARVMGAATAARAPGKQISGWSIDSRTLAPGDLFVALRGENHDGHDYVNAALGKGAAGAVVERDLDSPSLLIVEDTLAALQKLAGWARCRWAGRVVAVTGSAGKTTTKDVIAQLVAVEVAAG